MKIRCFCFILILILALPAILLSQTGCNNWAKVKQLNSGIQIGDLDVSGDKITVEALINRTAKIDELWDGGDVVSKHDNPSDVNYLLRPELAQITTTNGFFATKKPCSFELNKTYHIAMVYDGKSLKFFRNGFLMDEVPATGNLFQNNWLTKIGTTANTNSPYPADFLGYINEVRIWKVARSQNELRQYMNESLPNPTTQNGLLAYYTFDDLKNKQGNSQWDGSILGAVDINQNNANCSSFIADSCAITPVNVSAFFTGPDTVCENTPIQFNNQSVNASNYYWSFCTAGFNTTPAAKNLGDPGNTLRTPVFMDYALDNNGNYYGFVSNYENGHIVKLDYGNSLLNAPAATDLGNFGIIPIYAEGIQAKIVNGKCYVFTVAAGDAGGNGSALFRIDFGTSFANPNPAAVSLGNIGNLLFPHDLFITQENNKFYGFTININNNTITRFDFGSNIQSQPTGKNLGNVGNLNYPCGFSFVNSNGNWYAFITNRNNSSISRADFGTSLANTPTGVVIGNPKNLLNLPRDISIFQSCEGIVGLVVNEENEQTGTITKLNFGSDLLSMPGASNLGNLGNLKFPHSISKFFLEGNDIYSFITNVTNNTITRLRYVGCTNSSISSSTSQNPPAITYTQSGMYNVNLLVDIGLPTQTSFCKQIVVKDCSPIVTASFTSPDTICVNTPLKITNTSANATSYYWSFCQADLKQKPVGNNLGNIGSSLSLPVYSDIISQNGNFYVFVVNNSPGSLTRLDFGNNLLNTPSATSLGNFGGVLKNTAEGVQIINTGNHWYGIIVGGSPNAGVASQIMKLDFGSDITNISPIATDWGNIGNMSYPHELYIFNEKNNWYGFTANYENNTITRFDFGKDFSNPPTGSNLGGFGFLNGPTGISPIKDNNNWYLFITNGIGNTITRLNFGNSLLNTATAADLGNLNGTMHKCWDISIQKYCDQILGFVVNGDDNFNNIVRLDFNNDLNSTPSATSLGNIGKLSFPHSFSKLFRVNNDLYTIIPNAHNNTISRLKFSGCTNSSIPNSTQVNPPDIVYNIPGIYNINLSVDEGLPTQTTYCKQITVINCDTICNLKAGFIYQQASCDPKIIQFKDTTTNADSVLWDFGNGKTDTARNPIIKYKDYGDYIVHLYAKTQAGCLDTAIDTISVKVQIDSAIINRDTSICLGSSIQLNAINGLKYCWSPGTSLSDSSIQNPIASPQVTTTYYLNILVDSNQSVIHDSVTIIVISPPIVNAGNDVFICKGSSTQLNASGANSYLWNNSSALSDSTISNPIANPSTTTQFIVTGFNAQGCSSRDTVLVSVLTLPTISLVNDTSICKGGSVMLQANAIGNNSYNWNPSSTLSNATISNPIANPTDTTEYFVTVTDANGCMSQDSVTVNVLPRPFVTTINDTSICTGSSITLKTIAPNANSFKWTPASSLNNATIQSPVASPSNSTIYIVTAGNGVCNEKDSVVISLLALPSVIANKDTTICGNGSAQLAASGAKTYLWSPATSLSNPNTQNPIAKPNTTTTYFVTGTDLAGCTNTDSVVINVKPKPVFDLTPANADVCLGDSAKLTASGGDLYSWSPSQSITSTTSAVTTVYPAVKTTYKVIITDSECKETDSLFATVDIKQKPQVDVSKSNDVDCSVQQSQLIAVGGKSYLWSPDIYIDNIHIANPVVSPLQDIWYSVLVTGNNGCTAEDSILVKSDIANTIGKFYIPSAFTPNGDGLNDCFGVKYWGPADIFEMQIYNKWGQLIYESRNISECWDGRLHGKAQPSGTYVYQIKVLSACSKGVVRKSGTIVLIR